MKFQKSNVRLVSRKDIKTKAGNDMTFVTVADKTSFEVIELRLAPSVGQDLGEIVEGRDYYAEFDFDGQYGSVTLTAVKP